MAETNEQGPENINGPAPETPGTEPAKHPGGRPKKDQHKKDTQAIIDLAAPDAAQILADHIARKRSRRTIKASLQRACEYVIDHAIGKPKQKVEHSGGILTYGQLARDAEKLEDKPRPVLAEALSVAEKYQDKTAGGPENPEK